MSLLGDRQQLAYIASQAADARVNVELETEGMTLNIGPQHPATHGTLRIIARLDGEQVIWAEPSAGYMHRGYEKLTEVRTYPQVTALVNRIDWLGSFANEVPFILAAEKLMGVEAPSRAQHIRTILFELSRIANLGAASVNQFSSALTASTGAHAVHTDVFVSMGQEAETAKRMIDFKDFCVDSKVMANAAKDAIFMHCLPAHRGVEVMSEVIDGAQSRVVTQAHNRMHAARGLLAHLMGVTR
jgi:hypothetical protein